VLLRKQYAGPPERFQIQTSDHLLRYDDIFADIFQCR
jgi:hypothetical protein